MRPILDRPLLIAVSMLGLLSLSVLFVADRKLATNQFIFWIFGLALMYLVSGFNSQFWQKISFKLYLFCVLALLGVYLFADPIRGAVRWIDLGVFRFQPSEIAKIATILVLSSFFTTRNAKEWTNIVKGLLIILPVFLLIIVQPDIGSAVSIIAIWLGISYAAGLDKRKILAFILTCAVLLPVSYNLLASYQKERINTFLNPDKDPQGYGYNIIQSKIAVGSGKILGRGLGLGFQSQLKFLPEAESDFIFAALAEQLGLLGAGLVIILYVWLLVRILAYTEGCERFAQLVLVGTVSLLLYQFTVNIGMNMELIPVTGITLPLLSYGGSSLVSTLLLLGIVLALRKHHY